MAIHARRLWSTLIRTLMVLLILLLGAGLLLGFNPGLLRAAMQNIPGLVIDFPTPGPTPPLPVIAAPAGRLPVGWLAFSGETSLGSFSCGFLLELPDGRRVGLSTAHSIPALPAGTPGLFRTAAGTPAASLTGQIGYGQSFTRDHFSQDYVIWAVAPETPPGYFLQPDERGAGQPGERVLVFGRAMDGAGGSNRWQGTVLSSTSQHTWIRLDDSFNPNGYSGCPVISQVTGRVVGMAVAGADRSPVIMGLNPVGSLVEKAQAALGNSAQR